MVTTDRLADILHDLGIGCALAPHGPHTAHAARLAAAGVTVATPTDLCAPLRDTVESLPGFDYDARDGLGVQYAPEAVLRADVLAAIDATVATTPAEATVGPIQHSNSMCQKDGCTCWCQACERHNWRHAQPAPDALRAALTLTPDLYADLGEVLAFTVQENAEGRYVCHICESDVTTGPHSDDCEAEHLRRWTYTAIPALRANAADTDALRAAAQAVVDQGDVYIDGRGQKTAFRVPYDTFRALRAALTEPTGTDR